MTVTRRDILWGLGGGLAGAALTPVPWKLLDDTAIWTQRRHALPVPPRGARDVASRGLHAVPGRLRRSRPLRRRAARGRRRGEPRTLSAAARAPSG